MRYMKMGRTLGVATAVPALAGLFYVPAASGQSAREMLAVSSMVQHRAAELEALVAQLPADTRSAQPLPCDLSKVAATQGVSTRSAPLGPERRWPNGEIPYDFDSVTMFDDGLADDIRRTIAVNVMGILSDTCDVTFRPRTGGDTRGIRFFDTTNEPSPSNSSPIGPVTNFNAVSVVNWDFPYIVAHEIMHSMGWHHEQVRPDRDSFVRVNFGNIDDTAPSGPDPESCVGNVNFGLSPDVLTIFPYDFQSIMHYSGRAFSACSFQIGPIYAYDPADDQYVCPPNTVTTNCPDNGLTIATLNPLLQPLIGNRADLSDGDRAALRQMYGYTNIYSTTFGYASGQRPTNQWADSPEPLLCSPTPSTRFLGGASQGVFPGESAQLNSTAWWEFTGFGGLVDIEVSSSGPVQLRVLDEGQNAVLEFDGTSVSPSVSFQASVGATYKIAVSDPLGVGNGLPEVSAALVSISATCTSIPSNDDCASATFIPSLPVTVSGSTRAASEDSSLPFCVTSISAPGVWYQMVGNGGEVSATMCSEFDPSASTDFDTKLNVFRGDCNSPLCVTGNDDSACPAPGNIFSSTVTFDTQVGEDYFILVQGFDGEAGDYSLAIFETGNPSPPEVLSVTRVEASPAETDPVQFLAEFSTPVGGVDTTDFQVAEIGALSGSAVTGVRFTGGTEHDGAATAKAVSDLTTSANLNAGVTIAGWVYMNNLDTTGYILSTRSTDNTGVRLAVLTGGDLLFTTYGVQNYNTVDAQVPANRWTHVAAVWDSSEVRYYINGAHIETVSGSNFIVNSGSRSVTLGGDGLDATVLNGRLDDVGLWDIALTDAQIRELMFSSVPPTETGLVGFWTLDRFEDLGAGASGMNDLRDDGPNGLHLDGGTVVLRSGRPLDRSLRFFDNLSSRVLAPFRTDYKQPTLTIEAWVNPVDVPAGSVRRIVGNFAGMVGFGHHFNGRLLFTTYGVKDYIATTAPFTAGEWTHVAVTLDGSADARFYVNGTLVETVTGTNPPLTNGTGEFIIGGADGLQYWDGEIDEVRYWSGARSAAEIASNYNKRLAGDEPGLLGLWAMDGYEDLGVGFPGRSDMRDLSPAANHADVISVDLRPVFSGRVAPSAFVTVGVGTNTGPAMLGLDVLNDGSIVNGIGDPLTGGFVGGETYDLTFIPPGDECADAIAVGEGVFTGSTSDASASMPAVSCGMSDVSPDLWYAYTASETGMAQATTCRPGTNYDTVLTVYDACGGLEIGCNDDGGPAGTAFDPACDSLNIGANRASTVAWSVDAGVTYLVRVSGFDAESGSSELAISVAIPPCPCDFDGDESVNVLDLLDFLSEWFPLNAAADYDTSGTVDVLDLLEFLSCWFPASSGAACP